MTRTAAEPARRRYAPRMPAERRREQILDAALAIIVRDGYPAVSIDAIAREIEVTRPVVYNLFAGLDELLQQLLDRQERRAVGQLMATVAAGPPAGHRADLAGYLRRVVADLIAMVAADPATWTPILLASAATPAAVRERIERDRGLVRARFRVLVELSYAERPAPLGFDAGIAAHALLAVAEYFGRLILADPAAVDAERLAATVTALLL